MKEIIAKVYNYYPKNIYEFDNNYNKSKEDILFKETINLKHDEIQKKLIQNNFYYSKYYVFNIIGDQPSYNIQIELNSSLIMSIYISYLIPMYHIAYFINNTNNCTLFGIIYEIDDEFMGITEAIEKELKKILKYRKFPVEFLNEEFKDILKYNNFNARNAFFVDNYRMFNF